jgi:hypothetical protein
MAGIMRALSLHSMSALRAINAMLGLIPALIFFAIRRALGDPQALVYSAAFFFLPLIYPYYFLAYTDVLSLALVLGAFLLALKKRHYWAAVVLTTALLVRQNNVVWAGFIPALLIFFPTLSWSTKGELAALSKIACPYAFPVIVFLVYWAWHGSISLSKTMVGEHPDLAFHAGNLYFFLFAFVLLLFPQAFQGLKKYIGSIRQNPWLLLLPLILIVCAHLRGSSDNYLSVHYFLRNNLIQIVSRAPADFAFSALVAIGFCGIAFSQFLLPRGWLLYPFSAFYLGSSWLIENRYLIIPFALWMVMGRIENPRAAYWNLAIWACISLFFVWGIFSGRFML